jgi:hypothetical protein
MLSLRKRIKYNLNTQEEVEEKEDNYTIKRFRYEKRFSSNTNKLENLPIELLFCIFEKVDFNDLLNLRLVNNYFKNLIGYCSILWTNISLRLDDVSIINDLSNFLDFFESKPRLDLIRLDFPQLIQKSLYKKCIKIENKNKRSSKKYCLLINKINVLSMNILNYFSNDCTEMIIESFVLDNTSEIKDKNFHYYTSNLMNKFWKLESLELMCLLSDLDTLDLEIWNNVFKENMLLNSMNSILSNLSHFSLHYYTDSAKMLIKSLVQMKKLRSIQLIKSCPKDDLNEVDNNDSDKLDLESIEFKSTSISMVYFIFKHLVNLNTVKYLEIYVKEYFVNKSNLDELYLHDFFSIYLNKLINLDVFSTNLIQFKSIIMNMNSINLNQKETIFHFRQIHISNEPKTRSIKTIDASLFKRNSYKFDLNDFQRFLFKFQFSNLHKIQIKIRLNCLNLNSFYDEINRLVLVILNQKISSLKVIVVDFKCENCWNNLLVKNFCRFKDLNNLFDYEMMDKKVLKCCCLFFTSSQFLFEIK